MKSCTVESCERPFLARGMCALHYARARRGQKRPWTYERAVENFWSKVTKEPDGCWLYVGSSGNGGWCRFEYNLNRTKVRVPAHRFAYELLVGPIPDDLPHLDHLCKVRNCVNPDHLEPVTVVENNRRSESPTALNGRKTHCKHGHELTPENIYPVKHGRSCLTCRKRQQELDSVRRALKELAAAGLVRNSGRKRAAPSGSLAIVWTAT